MIPILWRSILRRIDGGNLNAAWWSSGRRWPYPAFHATSVGWTPIAFTSGIGYRACRWDRPVDPLRSASGGTFGLLAHTYPFTHLRCTLTVFCCGRPTRSRPTPRQDAAVYLTLFSSDNHRLALTWTVVFAVCNTAAVIRSIGLLLSYLTSLHDVLLRLVYMSVVRLSPDIATRPTTIHIGHIILFQCPLPPAYSTHPPSVPGAGFPFNASRAIRRRNSDQTKTEDNRLCSTCP